MKRLLILILAGLFTQLVVSCYPGGAEYVKDYDVAMTNYDKSADFAALSTFAIPDSIVHFSNDKDATADHQYDAQILDLVIKNFKSKGYTQVDTTQSPTFIVTVSAFSNVSYSYYMDNWYNNWNWYYGNSWWPGTGPFNPYYSWYPASVYSYRSGSLVIDMISTTLREDNKVDVVWNAIADGLLQGSDASILYRLEKQINQCFVQSPYLQQK